MLPQVPYLSNMNAIQTLLGCWEDEEHAWRQEVLPATLYTNRGQQDLTKDQ